MRCMSTCWRHPTTSAVPSSSSLPPSRRGGARSAPQEGRQRHRAAARRRSVHPSAPASADLRACRRARRAARSGQTLRALLDDAAATVRWVAGRSPERAAAAHRVRGAAPSRRVSDERGASGVVRRPRHRTRRIRNDGERTPGAAFHRAARHPQRAGRTASEALARINLNYDRLPPGVAAAANATGVSWPSANTATSIVTRHRDPHAVHEAVRIIESYEPPPRAAAPVRCAPPAAAPSPRRRAAASTSATRPMARGSSPRRASFRRRRRTRRTSRRSCGRLRRCG